jgi:hypothetical protein
MKAWLLLLAALGGIVCLTVLESFQGTATPDGESAAVTYSHGTVRVSIPYTAPHAGAGQLTVEVLDPDDQVLGRAEQSVAVGAGKGHWQEDLKLAKPMPIDELAWQRLRYRFSYDGHQGEAAAAAIEGTESISQILRMPVVHILGQQSYLSGGQAAVRVIVTDSNNEAIAGPSSVRIELAPEGRKTRALFTGRLNARGTVEAQFRFPAGLVGSYPIALRGRDAHRRGGVHPAGATGGQGPDSADHREADLSARPDHTRAGIGAGPRASRGGGRAQPDLRGEDSRGNKVFKKATQTDKFGIASAEFELADEVNLGTYHLRAVMGTEEAGTNTAELALNVERYVLPKFKVAIDFASKDNHAKRGYRPGDHVTGTVRANYFFGKPVDGAEIGVKASGMDVAEFEAVSAQGKTDREGTYRFDLRLPITSRAGR